MAQVFGTHRAATGTLEWRLGTGRAVDVTGAAVDHLLPAGTSTACGEDGRDPNKRADWNGTPRRGGAHRRRPRLPGARWRPTGPAVAVAMVAALAASYLVAGWRPCSPTQHPEYGQDRIPPTGGR